MVGPKPFRGTDYYRFVTFGKRTIKQGECCAIWTQDGKQHVYEGPKLKYIWRSTVRFMTQKNASQNQYLVIRHKDGKKEHIRGPKALFEDPVKFDSITVEDAISLNSFESVIVYQEVKSGKVERRIVSGPTLFVPEANEWLHKFSWHGPDDESKTKYHAGKNQFIKLKTIPEQIYYNCRDVRSSDDVQLTIKFMIFYELKDVEKMLDTTSDPIGDFINALSADVLSFASTRTFEELVTKTGDFNDMGNYKVLTQRAKRAGFMISKVVYRGYQASEHIEKMHQQATITRNNNRLKTETSEQDQLLEDMKLRRRLERVEQERKLEAESQLHKLEMQDRETQRKIGQMEAEHKEKMRQKKTEADEEEKRQKHQYKQKAEYLKSLNEMGVNLTTYLTTPNRLPDKVIKIESDSKSNPIFLADSELK